jgi:hypothetical protein
MSEAISSVKSILADPPVSADPAGYLRKASGKKFCGIYILLLLSNWAADAEGGGEGGLGPVGEVGDGRWKPS